MYVFLPPLSINTYDLYAAGLHKEGSDAVERYTKLDIKDRFVLMCAAFKQPMYKVDENLNVIEE